MGSRAGTGGANLLEERIRVHGVVLGGGGGRERRQDGARPRKIGVCRDQELVPLYPHILSHARWVSAAVTQPCRNGTQPFPRGFMCLAHVGVDPFPKRFVCSCLVHMGVGRIPRSSVQTSMAVSTLSWYCAYVSGCGDDNSKNGTNR